MMKSMFRKASFLIRKPRVSILPKVGIVLWILLILVALGLFVGGIFSSNQHNRYGQSNCLLYANTALLNHPLGLGLEPIIFNPEFPNEFTGFIISNPAACSSAVFEGVGAIMIAILLSIFSAYYIFTNQSPQRTAAWALTIVSVCVTVFMVTVTAIASSGLVYTCAPLGDSCKPFFSFLYFTTTGLGLTRIAIAFGWVASALFLLFTGLSAYWLGKQSRAGFATAPPDMERENMALGREYD